MADSASIGSSFSNYTGDAALGGAKGEPVEVSTSPLEKFAAFSDLKNRFFWIQKNKDADELITKVANLNERLDMSALYKGDRDKLMSEVADVTKKASELARQGTSGNPSDKLRVNMQIEDLQRPVIEKYNSAKKRALAMSTQQAEIEQKYADSPDQMKIQLDDLDNRMKNSGIMDRVDPLLPYKPKVISISPPVMVDVGSGGTGKNVDSTSVKSVFVPSANIKGADEMELGIKNLHTPKTIKNEKGEDIPNPEYDELKERMQLSAPDNESSIWVDANKNFNEIRRKYVVDGKFNRTAFIKDNSNNDKVMEVFADIEKLSNNSRQGVIDVANGLYSYKGIGDVPKQLTADDFKPGIIDFDNDITPRQFGLAAISSKSIPTGTKVTMSRHNTAIDSHFKEEGLKNQSRQLDIAEGKLKGKTAVGGDMITGAALTYIQHMRNLIPSLTSGKYKDGVKVPVGGIDTYTKKALELGDVTENGAVSVAFYPNGTIQVLDKNDKVIKTSSQESLVLGFISASKGLNTDASMTEGFVEKSQAAFNQMVFRGLTPTQYFRQYLEGSKELKKKTEETKTESGDERTIKVPEGRLYNKK